MNNFRTIDLQEILVKEKEKEILKIQSILLLKKVWTILLIFALLFTSIWFLLKESKVEKTNAFIYTEKAKIEDLKAIKENRERYLAKINTKPIKKLAINNFKAKKVVMPPKENKIKIKGNKWTDEKVINEAIKYLKRKEWVRYKAYWDFKQYSICYGTKSKKWATATHKECEQQLKERVQKELLRINRSADNLDWNKKVALISFFYNTWYKHNIMMYAKRNDHNSVTYLMNKYIYSNWKALKWLVKRRAEEIKIYKN